MLKSLRFIGLAILLIMAPATLLADSQPMDVIVVSSGVTHFEMGGQQFVCATAGSVRITFSLIDSGRVAGAIFPLTGNTAPVRLIWLSASDRPLTLHNRIIGGKASSFDSEDVTGHNEKFQIH